MNKQQENDMSILIKRRINKIYSRVKGKPLTPIKEEEWNEIHNKNINIDNNSSSSPTLSLSLDSDSFSSIIKANKMNRSYDDIENIKPNNNNNNDNNDNPMTLWVRALDPVWGRVYPSPTHSLLDPDPAKSLKT